MPTMIRYKFQPEASLSLDCTFPSNDLAPISFCSSTIVSSTYLHNEIIYVPVPLPHFFLAHGFYEELTPDQAPRSPIGGEVR
ncbi:hypothetical protein Pst134EB_031212 [Puccinia striiformis f. sp. tritici]|nr:hypothetical protein Pst134EB_031212 [Puccinia striiformis f. sp. tritici]